MKKLPLVLLFVALVAKCHGGLTPPQDDANVDDFNPQDAVAQSPDVGVGAEAGEEEESEDEKVKKDLVEVPCDTMKSTCKGCTNLQHCVFALYSNNETLCVDQKTEIDALKTLVQGKPMSEVRLSFKKGLFQSRLWTHSSIICHVSRSYPDWHLPQRTELRRGRHQDQRRSRQVWPERDDHCVNTDNHHAGSDHERNHCSPYERDHEGKHNDFNF